MGKTNLQYGLDKKYASLAGELLDVQSQIERIEQLYETLPDLRERESGLKCDLEKVIAVIRMDRPDWSKDQIRPVQPFKHSIPIPHGDCSRRALEVLRDAKEPMTAREIALTVLSQTGVVDPDPEVAQKVTNAVLSALRARKGTITQADGNSTKRWSIRMPSEDDVA